MNGPSGPSEEVKVANEAEPARYNPQPPAPPYSPPRALIPDSTRGSVYRPRSVSVVSLTTPGIFFLDDRSGALGHGASRP